VARNAGVHIEDPYKILDVSSNATRGEIEKAFGRLARKYHPDLNKSPDAREVRGNSLGLQ